MTAKLAPLEIVSASVAGLGYELVDFEHSARGLMRVFIDKPDGIGACARRNRSTTSIQSLILMNSGFTALHTRKFAERLQREAGPDAARQVDRAYALEIGRAHV